jgi:cellobiose phosphorylase
MVVKFGRPDENLFEDYMHSKQPSGWQFIDNQGTFELLNPQDTNYLYFPLSNQAGLFSSLTPTLNGDAKTGQNAFLLLPVSVQDLHNSRSGRNFWVTVKGRPWSVTGNSAVQIGQTRNESDQPVTMQAGFLWHTINRIHPETGLHASVTNFIPPNEDTVELMRVTLINCGNEPLEITPTAAIPIFGRSADNLRDHRHVTSLLQRTQCHRYGVIVKPTMSFDERGHTTNQTTYAVLGADGDGVPPCGFFPLVDDFIGEGGSLDWPKALVEDNSHPWKVGSTFEGQESMGGLQFPLISLEPGETHTYVIILAIIPENQTAEELIFRYGSQDKFEMHLEKTKAYWKEKLGRLRFEHHDARFDGWLQWVTLQPELRRMMGNSFLPYHDYGRGGRGWRDLWQDLLALLLTDGSEARHLIRDNFAGTRMDGSNANIVGSRPGEFKADRNSIPRVWMDHGAWPLLTIMLYLDLSGDLGLLLEKQTYFKDHLTHRCQNVDPQWKPEHGLALRTQSGELFQGTILEHLLVQHLTAFYNVGDHNIIRLEGGDWNDGLDMASAKGESAAFSALYAANLRSLGKLCLALVESGIPDTSIAVELLPLLDRISHPIDYQSVRDKQNRLYEYFDSVCDKITGETRRIPLTELASDLCEKGDWLANHIQKQEWVADQQGLGWFNGYYDNKGIKVEGEHPTGIRMTLTGQVFPMMAEIATKEQAQHIVQAANRYLNDEYLRGYRLNTNFGQDLPELGRAFGFAYGHKENGALFNHMAVMYAYALYRQGLADEAWQVLEGIYLQSQDFAKSRCYPCIPEYFNPQGRGMYPYLTGSAAWYLFTLLTEAYGVKGRLGDLLLEPKLTTEQFANTEQLKVQTAFAGKNLEVTYRNTKGLPYGRYSLEKISINGMEKSLHPGAVSALITRDELAAFPEPIQILISLGARPVLP